MKFKCVDLFNIDAGKISIGGCHIGDSPEIAIEKLKDYSRVDEDKKGSIRCWLDIDLMWPRNVLADKSVWDASIYCDYDPKAKNGIRLLEITTNCLDSYPYHSIAEIEEKIESITRSRLFDYSTPVISPKSLIGYTSIKSALCELELIWTKKEYSGYYFFNILVGPNSDDYLDTPFERNLLLNRSVRKLSVELGKLPKDLTDSDIKEAKQRVGIKEIG